MSWITYGSAFSGKYIFGQDQDGYNMLEKMSYRRKVEKKNIGRN
jgi:hypothetical protein